MLLLSAARHSRNQTLGSGVHPRPGWRGARNGEAVRLLTPEGVPGVDIRFRAHDIRSLIGLISAREKCQSQTVREPNAQLFHDPEE